MIHVQKLTRLFVLVTLATLAGHTALALEVSAVRTLSAPDAAGVITATIQIQVTTPGGESAPGGLIVSEFLPLGSTVTASTPPHDYYRTETGEIAWLLLSASGVSSQTVTYQFNPTTSSSSSRAVNGQIHYLVNDRSLVVPIRGEQSPGVGGANLQTLVLQPGPADGKDTFISSDEPDRNFGNTKILTAEYKAVLGSTRSRRILLQFGLTSIPQNANITSAALELYSFDNHTQGRLSIHPVLESWTEGSGIGIIDGAPVTKNDASWKNANTGAAWSAPGGGFGSSIGQSEAAGVGWIRWNVTSLVQSWRQGTQPNHGLLIKLDSESGESRSAQFSSSDSSTRENRPRLVIQYETVVNTGSITGLVADETTGQPLDTALVTLQGRNTNLSAWSFAGGFTFSNVPPGVGYTISAQKEGYQTSAPVQVNVQAGQVTSGVLLKLKPSGVNQLVLVALPGTGTEFPTVMKGGNALRYYLILDAQTQKQVEGRVEVQYEVSGVQQTVYSNQGVVGIRVDQVTSPTNVKITHVGGKPLPTNWQVMYDIQVMEPDYGVTWKRDESKRLGVSFPRGEMNSSLQLTARENKSIATGPDALEIGRIKESGIGVELKASIGGGVGFDFGNTVVGIEGRVSAGAEGMALKHRDDYYHYPYHTQEKGQAVAKYVFTADGILEDLPPELVNILAYLGEKFFDTQSLSQHYHSIGAGLLLRPGAGVSGSIQAGAFSDNFTLGGVLKAGGDFQAELDNSFNYLFQTSQFESQASLSTELTGDVKWGVGVELLGGGVHNGVRKAGDPQFSIFNNIGEFRGYWQQQWGFLLNLQNNYLRLQSILLEVTKKGFTSDRSEKVRYRVVSTNPNTLASILNNGYLQTSPLGALYANIYQKVLMKVDPNTPSVLLAGFFNSILAAQKQGLDVQVYYEVEQEQQKNIEGSKLNIEGEITSALSFELNVGRSLSQNDVFPSERGVWYMGKHYPTELYPSGAFPAMNVTFHGVMQGILNDLRQEIGSTWTTVIQVINTVGGVINDPLGSVLTIAEGAMDAGQEIIVTVWEWGTGQSPFKTAGRQPSPGQLYRQSVKLRAIESQGFIYGIGGFHRFDPDGLVLKVPSPLKLAYKQDEVAGIDESRLAIFFWDSNSNRWKYVGGTIDPIANTVTVSITVLHTYTIGVIAPSGEIDLLAEANTLPADDASQLTIKSSVILGSDGEMVPDGTLFTVSTDRGRIVSPDVQEDVPGLQVQSAQGIISILFQSDQSAGEAVVQIRSLEGDAQGSLSLVLIDSTPPEPPIQLTAEAGSQSMVLAWKDNPATDLEGYWLHYRIGQSGPPYDATGTIDLAASPIRVGNATAFVLSGLEPNVTYFIAVTAQDSAGNQSIYSNEISVTTLAVKPENVAPTMTLVYRQGRGKVSAGSVMEIEVQVQDGNVGDTTILTMPTAPEGASLLPYESGGLILWMPTNNQSGTHAFELIATDSHGAQSRQTFTIDVVVAVPEWLWLD